MRPTVPRAPLGSCSARQRSPSPLLCTQRDVWLSAQRVALVHTRTRPSTPRHQRVLLATLSALLFSAAARLTLSAPHHSLAPFSSRSLASRHLLHTHTHTHAQDNVPRASYPRDSPWSTSKANSFRFLPPNTHTHRLSKMVNVCVVGAAGGIGQSLSLLLMRQLRTAARCSMWLARRALRRTCRMLTTPA